MDRQKKNSAIPILLIVAGCALYMVSGGIRSNFGIIVQALADRTGVSYADVSFAVAVGQLMYGVTQPVFGIVAMKRSNGFVLVLGTLLMATGLLLTTLGAFCGCAGGDVGAAVLHGHRRSVLWHHHGRDLARVG